MAGYFYRLGPKGELQVRHLFFLVILNETEIDEKFKFNFSTCNFLIFAVCQQRPLFRQRKPNQHKRKS